MSEEDRPISWWVGRIVRRTDTDETFLGAAVVLAVDDTPYRPSAWIKYDEREYPTYRSIDLCDLQDVETGVHGEGWGTGGPEEAMRQSDHFYPPELRHNRKDGA